MNYHTPSDAIRMNLSLLSIFSWIISGTWVTPTVFDTLSPNDLLMANPCISVVILFNTLIRQPYSLRTDWTSILVPKRMDLASTFQYSPFLSLNSGFMILRQVNHFPIFLINCIKQKYTLPSKNRSTITHIGAYNVFLLNEYIHHCWATAWSVNFRIVVKTFLKLIVYYRNRLQQCWLVTFGLVFEMLWKILHQILGYKMPMHAMSIRHSKDRTALMCRQIRLNQQTVLIGFMRVCHLHALSRPICISKLKLSHVVLRRLFLHIIQRIIM